MSRTNRENTARKTKPPATPKTIRPRRRSAQICEPWHDDAHIIVIGGKLAEADTRIVDLIETMNDIPGVETTSSWRGVRGLGYVAFQGPNAVTFMAAMAEMMAEQLAIECPPSTPGNMAPFMIEIRDRLSMGWLPSTYPVVLAAAKRAGERVGARIGPSDD